MEPPAAQLTDPLFLLKRTGKCGSTIIAEPVLRAVDTANKLVRHLPTACALFLPVARLLYADVSADQLSMIVEEFIVRVGCDVAIDHLQDSIMRIDPAPADPRKAFARPLMLFNSKLVQVVDTVQHSARAERQEFLHLVKILHEYTHLLTAPLLAFAQAKHEGIPFALPTALLPTPTKAGMVNTSMGSAWEELTFGGRIVLNKAYLNIDSYAMPLMLRSRPYEDLPPNDVGNASLSFISRDYISSKLALLAAWKEGDPLPSLTIPAADLILETFSKAITKEEAANPLQGMAKAKRPLVHDILDHQQPPAKIAAAEGSHQEDWTWPGTAQFTGDSDEQDDREDGPMTGGPPTVKQIAAIRGGVRI